MEIRRSGFLDFSKSGRSGSGRDQEIKPPDKSTVEISQNFVAFLECMNFKLKLRLFKYDKDLPDALIFTVYLVNIKASERLRQIFVVYLENLKFKIPIIKFVFKYFAR